MRYLKSCVAFAGVTGMAASVDASRAAGTVASGTTTSWWPRSASFTSTDFESADFVSAGFESADFVSTGFKSTDFASNDPVALTSPMSVFAANTGPGATSGTASGVASSAGAGAVASTGSGAVATSAGVSGT